MTKKTKIKDVEEFYSDGDSESDSETDIRLHTELFNIEVEKIIYNTYKEISTSIIFPYDWHYYRFYRFIDCLLNNRFQYKFIYYTKEWENDITPYILNYYVNIICNMLLRVNKRLHITSELKENIKNYIYCESKL